VRRFGQTGAFWKIVSGPNQILVTLYETWYDTRRPIRPRHVTPLRLIPVTGSRGASHIKNASFEPSVIGSAARSRHRTPSNFALPRRSLRPARLGATKQLAARSDAGRTKVHAT